MTAEDYAYWTHDQLVGKVRSLKKALTAKRRERSEQHHWHAVSMVCWSCQQHLVSLERDGYEARAERPCFNCGEPMRETSISTKDIPPMPESR